MSERELRENQIRVDGYENKNGTPEKTVRKGLGSMGQRPGETSVKRRDKSCVTLGERIYRQKEGVGGLQSL